MSTLFTPLTLRDVTFAHRAWMSPMMQFSGVADGPEAGTPTDWHLQHFGSRVVGGVALAMVAAARGYKFVATMVETFSVERRKLMRAYGAKVILTPAAERGSGMVRKAKELAEKHGWFLARQFENEANPAWHRNTTGPEILQDFVGKRLDYFVSGWGTGGTLTGVGQTLKLARPTVKIVSTEPAGAQLLGGKEWQPHKIQGWTPDFIPAVLDRSVVDDIKPIEDLVARDTARRLAAEEGVFVGLSAGATLAAALQVANEAPAGSVILAMLPDTGERYLSTILFEGVSEGSDDEWLASLDASANGASPGKAA